MQNSSRRDYAVLMRSTSEEREYAEKIDGLWAEVQEAAANQTNKEVLLLASQSGLPLDLLDRLRKRLKRHADSLPGMIKEWIEWTLRWLARDDEARSELLGEIKGAVLSASGKKVTSELDGVAIMALKEGLLAWISGAPVCQIETRLGGKPDGATKTPQMCPRARTLIATVIPRGLAYTVSVIARMVEELELIDQSDEANIALMSGLPSAVRRGFDTIHKIEFANRNKKLMSRVQIHQAYSTTYGLDAFDDDI